MDYHWQLFQKSWNFRLPNILQRWIPTWMLRNIFRPIWGRDVTFGIWLRTRTDGVVESCTSALTASSKESLLYEPLRDLEIRLLVLHPGCYTEPIRGHLMHTTLEDPEPYEAISYVWGTAEFSSTIEINGHVLGLTRNAMSALFRLRSEINYKAVWMDCVCINQNDWEEKPLQVQLMNTVYRQATQVDIYLGETTPNTLIGMEVLSYLASETQRDERPPWETHNSELVMAGVRDIMSRDWFRRIWVVQEAALSKMAVLICGEHRLTWDAEYARVRRFQRRIKFAEISPTWRECGLDKFDLEEFIRLLELQQRKIRNGLPAEPQDLLDLAYEFRFRQSADPRDKLWALWTLAEGMEDFRPDYTMSVDETFRSFNSMLRI